MRRLIVNADDFGLTDGINRAIIHLHQLGALQSSTLMAAAPRFSEAVELSTQHRSLGVGCHIMLVDGSPVANPAAVPTLLDSTANRTGEPRFRPTLGAFVRDLTLGRIDRAHIEQEAIAQILRVQQAGISVTHVDTHKHAHMFPTVLDAVMRAAKVCDVHAIRNPFEPSWSVKATPDARAIRTLQVRLLRSFRHNFWKLAHEREFVTTDGCLGVAATGILEETALCAILNRMPEGTWELVCHPAYMDAELHATRTRLQQSRQVELNALQALPAMIEDSGSPIQAIHFGQLIPSARSASG